MDLASKSIDMDEGSDPEDANQEVNKKNETEKIDKLLETPPGLNLFPVDLSSNQNGFKHFNLGKITILSSIFYFLLNHCYLHFLPLKVKEFRFDAK